jgi:hypothetical protein
MPIKKTSKALAILALTLLASVNIYTTKTYAYANTVTDCATDWIVTEQQRNQFLTDSGLDLYAPETSYVIGDLNGTNVRLWATNTSQILFTESAGDIRFTTNGASHRGSGETGFPNAIFQDYTVATNTTPYVGAMSCIYATKNVVYDSSYTIKRYRSHDPVEKLPLTFTDKISTVIAFGISGIIAWGFRYRGAY